VLLLALPGRLGAQEQRVDLERAPLPKGMIRIDGAKNPELIPQWLLWREAFAILYLTKPPPSAFWEALDGLTTEERDLLYRECVAQREYYKRLEPTVTAEQKRLQAAGEEPKVLKAKLQERELEWRWTILKGRDRVLEALSPESRELLLAEIERYRTGISSVMPDEDLEHFNRPQ
jgi:hypothetical protein